jgi:hypothetical protein
MKRDAACLSAVFVDYDNIYLSLKRKSEEAAKRFAREAPRWLREIENGSLITPTNAPFGSAPRRIVMNRCYGNPVPRRNTHDNSTDMSSFPFVRHHFLRSGFEVIDCPPLTAQLKNSADIRMVMDIRDLLLHDTYFDEFIILSGDADFTPVLIRLRAHARRTVVFANDFTAAPYTAICDGEVREAALIELILTGELAEGSHEDAPSTSGKSKIEAVRREILAEVIAGVRASASPVPLEALADRAVRALGHERTIATGWAGAGSFRELLRRGLPEDIKLTGDPPYLAFEPKRHQQEERPPRKAAEAAGRAGEAPGVEPTLADLQRAALREIQAEAPGLRHAGKPAEDEDAHADAPAELMQAETAAAPTASRRTASLAPAEGAQSIETQRAAPRGSAVPRAPTGQHPVLANPQRLEPPSPIQQSIARIQEACQAPPLAPQEYRVLFEIMAREINDHDLLGVETLASIARQAQQRGIELRRDDIRFVLEVVSEADPWFEQGASPDLFASRFRTFVVARCRGQGLNLSGDELQLIDAWFLGSGMSQRTPPHPAMRATPAIAAPLGEALSDGEEQDEEASETDAFPRVVRTRFG